MEKEPQGNRGQLVDTCAVRRIEREAPTSSRLAKWWECVTGIATLNFGNLYIEDIVQKTYIEVNEHGTRAGAATVIAAPTETAIEEEPIYINFDRPFVYMILDRKTYMPIMMGTVMDIGS